MLEEIVRVFGLDGIPSRFSGPFVTESPVDVAYNFQMGLRRKHWRPWGSRRSRRPSKLIASEAADGAIAQVKDALPLRPPAGRRPHPRVPAAQRGPLRTAPRAHARYLIAAAVRNSNQGVSGLRFFELGRVFLYGRRQGQGH